MVSAYQIRTTHSVSFSTVSIVIFKCFIGFNNEIVVCVCDFFSSADLDDLLPPNDKDTSNADIELKSSVDVYHAVSRFLSLFKEKSPAYSERLERVCRYLLKSIESENPKLSYIGVALNKVYSIAWIHHNRMMNHIAIHIHEHFDGNVRFMLTT